MTADMKFLLETEGRLLASYASKASCSRGRKYAEEPHLYRTDFQRDRERIIHSRAFRRLEYKTQVFINSEGDHYRTRLTHTIEVAQIARTLARALRLNEDLAESIALAHDLGHPPFGHAGERALNSMLTGKGGFEHNRQSLRVVDFLETNYADFPGLNLTWETREGIIRHSPEISEKYLKEFSPDEHPSLEAQIIDLADEIAYNNHDLDDGISSGILDPEEVRDLTLWKMSEERFKIKNCSDKKMRARIVIRGIINLLATDLIENTEKNLKALDVDTADDIRSARSRTAVFSQDMEQACMETKLFLTENLYRHYRVSRMTIKAEKVIRDLFNIYTNHPETMPDSFCLNHGTDDPEIIATDYIAGMTDRFALEEHSKLTDPSILA